MVISYIAQSSCLLQGENQGPLDLDFTSSIYMWDVVEGEGGCVHNIQLVGLNPTLSGVIYILCMQ